MSASYAPISLKTHAILDAILLGFILIAPWLLGYTEHAGATQWSVALFFIGMGLNLVTDYPLGIIRKLPMKFHRMVEMTSPGLFIAIPWLFFREAGAMPLAATAVGLGVLLNTLLTRQVPAPTGEA
jgi:hypothetical protein